MIWPTKVKSDDGKTFYADDASATRTQGADERLPALPKAFWTVGGVGVFTEHQMQGYANAALALNRADDAQPVAIYQVRYLNESSWDDCSKRVFDDVSEECRRIVYAIRDAAQIDALSDEQMDELHAAAQKASRLTFRSYVRDSLQASNGVES